MKNRRLVGIHTPGSNSVADVDSSPPGKNIGRGLKGGHWGRPLGWQKVQQFWRNDGGCHLKANLCCSLRLRQIADFLGHFCGFCALLVFLFLFLSFRLSFVFWVCFVVVLVFSPLFPLSCPGPSPVFVSCNVLFKTNSIREVLWGLYWLLIC